jgi:hypothetical protein
LNYKIFVGVSVVVSFIFTNVYWLVTATYIQQVKNIGEPGVLIGFAAVQKLLSLHGFGAYLKGAYGYFFAALISCLTVEYLVRERSKLVTFGYAIGIGLICSVSYFLLSTTVRIQNKVSGTDVLLTGIDALSEMNLVSIIVGIIGIWILLNITVFIDLGIKRILKNNSIKQEADEL